MFDSTGARWLPMQVAAVRLVLVACASLAFPAAASAQLWASPVEIVPPDRLQNDELGISVAVDGPRAVVGAWQRNGQGTSAGAAFVFVKSGETWALEAELAPTGNLFIQAFGRSVDISGDTIIVGAYHENFTIGSAYVFVRDGSEWTLQQKLIAEGAQYAQQEYGGSVAVSGDTAVVGARGAYKDDWVRCGTVYVYTRTNGTWSLQQQLYSPAPDHAQQFGQAVAISDDTLAVGAWFRPDVSGDLRGVFSSAYAFTRTNGVWDDGEQLIATESEAHDEFGTSVAVSGDTIVVGAQHYNVDYYGPGAAYVFVREGGGWTEQQMLYASNWELGDMFGHSVAIDGDSVLVGAWARFDRNEGAGVAYAFERTGDTWLERQELHTTADVNENAGFGASVSISSANAVVGAPFQYLGWYQTGSAYAFSLKAENGTPCTAATECASGACVDGVCCTAGCGACGVCSVAAGAPANGVCAAKPPNTSCRSAAGICDRAETCDGVGLQCPSDLVVDLGTTCRPAAGPCDVAETCTGTSAACPQDIFRGSGVICRATAGACDVVERCDGMRSACPTDLFADRGAVCRSAVGLCDLPEQCDGLGSACPSDGFRSTSTVCRAAAGACDRPELCNGTPHCPADTFVAPGPECRASAGPCDVAEACEGGAQCPIDRFAIGTECRASAGECDLPELCEGVDAQCPADVLASSSATCRAASGVCDVAEHCNGTSTTCPSDALAPDGQRCGADGSCARGACELPPPVHDAGIADAGTDASASDAAGSAEDADDAGEPAADASLDDSGVPVPTADSGAAPNPGGAGGASGQGGAGTAGHDEGDDAAVSASEIPRRSGGCSCQVAVSAQPPPLALAGLWLTIALRVRRRRRGRQPPACLR